MKLWGRKPARGTYFHVLLESRKMNAIIGPCELQLCHSQFEVIEGGHSPFLVQLGRIFEKLFSQADFIQTFNYGFCAKIVAIR